MLRYNVKTKIKNIFVFLKESATELLYPSRCPFCDGILPFSGGRNAGRKAICDSCRKTLDFVRDSYCMKCGKPLEKQEQEFCRDCCRVSHFFQRGRFLLVYKGSVRKSVYRFKYAGRKEYATGYAALVKEELADFIKKTGAEALVPVPLHPKRQRKRGYNQAALLAREIGKRVNLPVLDDVVIRTKNTIPQKLLGRGERQNNLKKAFKINRNDVKLNTIIIIDDIYTTGSTIDAISKLFLENGVKQVFFLVLSGGR